MWTTRGSCSTCRAQLNAYSAYSRRALQVAQFAVADQRDAEVAQSGLCRLRHEERVVDDVQARASSPSIVAAFAALHMPKSSALTISSFVSGR